MVMQRRRPRLSARQRELRRTAEQAAIMLSAMPGAIEAVQAEFDAAQHAYDKMLINISLGALTLELFAGKDGEKRAASNDTERKMAIEYERCNNEEFRKVEAAYEEVKRRRENFRLENENYQLIAKLTIAQIVN
jgi:hypothetical protein